MTSLKHLAKTCMLAAIASQLVGCFAIADLDRFEIAELYVDINDISEITNHANMVDQEDEMDDDEEIDPTEIRLDLGFVNLNDGTLGTRVIFDGFRVAETGWIGRSFPGLLIPGDRYLAVAFADRNRNGIFDEGNLDAVPEVEPRIPPEFAWIANVTNRYADFQLSEDPVTPDDYNISDRDDFSLSITAFMPHSDGEQQLELMVIDKAANRLVGYYRTRGFVELDVDIVIHGIIDPEREYLIEFYADFDRDRSFTFGEDHSWSIEYDPGTDGKMTFKHVFATDGLSFF